LSAWQVEHPDGLGDLPCVQCQLLSPEPGWDALERVPYPPRLPFIQQRAVTMMLWSTPVESWTLGPVDSLVTIEL